MKLIRRSDDHCFYIRIREHVVQLRVGGARVMNRGHFLQEILGQIANGVQLGIAGLATSIKMRNLRNAGAIQFQLRSAPAQLVVRQKSRVDARVGRMAVLP